MCSTPLELSLKSLLPFAYGQTTPIACLCHTLDGLTICVVFKKSKPEKMQRMGASC